MAAIFSTRYLHLKDELVASDAKLRLEQNGELLLGDGLRSSPVRPLDPLQRLRGRERTRVRTSGTGRQRTLTRQSPKLCSV